MLILTSNVRKEADRKKYATDLENKDKNWKKIISVIDEICYRVKGSNREDSFMKIQYQYQLYMTLLHRMSDQQIPINTSSDDVYAAVRFYYGLCERYAALWNNTRETDFFLLPSVDRMILRYMKSLKLAAMVSNDLAPGLRLTDAPDNLLAKMKGEEGKVQNTLLLFSRYIYLENTSALHQGMRNLKKRMAEKGQRENDAGNWWSKEFQETFEPRREKVKLRLTECYENLDGEGKQDEILMQNILSSFCLFWHKSMGCAPVTFEGSKCMRCAPVTFKGGESLDQITGMLMYYELLDKLSDEVKENRQDDFPYYYEKLCRSMCKITGFAMCYIAYDEDGSSSGVFTQSGYHAEMFLSGRLLNADSLKEVLCRARVAWEKEALLADSAEGDWELTPNIAVLRKKGESVYLVIRISVGSADSFERGFYVIFQSDTCVESRDGAEDEIDREMMQKTRNILFMREKLQKVLVRDYTVLKYYRFDFSYVRKLQKKDEQEGPSALHLSDLHIMSDVTVLSEEAKDTIKANLRDHGVGKVDLLVVSGDIIDSRNASAGDIERNYSYAEELLNNVVVQIWKDGSGYLPHDWRKRVIITTGNHDYASMNQYQAVQKHRSLVSAMPAETDSNTMAKFTYYIEFLMRFLGMPLDELLCNDLNEVRYYRRMNMKVISLNCSGKATPLRTNKIGVNSEKLAPLLAQAKWRDSPAKTEDCSLFRMCVAHYSPEYELSYFMDAYGETMPGWAWDPEEAKHCKVNMLVGQFCALMQSEIKVVTGGAEDTLEKEREDFKQFMGQLRDVLDVMKNQKKPNAIKGEHAQGLYDAIMKHISPDDPKFGEKAENEVERMRQCELYRQMEQYLKWLEAPDTSDERMMKVMYEISQCTRIGESDKKEFKKVIDEIVDASGIDGKLDLHLAGHIHSYAESEDKIRVRKILVADRLYHTGEAGINGYLITDMREGKECQHFRLG